MLTLTNNLGLVCRLAKVESTLKESNFSDNLEEFQVRCIYNTSSFSMSFLKLQKSKYFCSLIITLKMLQFFFILTPGLVYVYVINQLTKQKGL